MLKPYKRYSPLMLVALLSTLALRDDVEVVYNKTIVKASALEQLFAYPGAESDDDHDTKAVRNIINQAHNITIKVLFGHSLGLRYLGMLDYLKAYVLRVDYEQYPRVRTAKGMGSIINAALLIARLADTRATQARKDAAALVTQA